MSISPPLTKCGFWSGEKKERNKLARKGNRRGSAGKGLLLSETRSTYGGAVNSSSRKGRRGQSFPLLPKEGRRSREEGRPTRLNLACEYKDIKEGCLRKKKRNARIPREGKREKVAQMKGDVEHVGRRDKACIVKKTKKKSLQAIVRIKRKTGSGRKEGLFREIRRSAGKGRLRSGLCRGEGS